MLSRALIAFATSLIASSAANAQSCVVWSVPGQPPNGRIDELVNFNNLLVARGTFTTAGGITAKGIAAFDGGAWNSMGAGLESVASYTHVTGGGARNTIAVWGGLLYAVGPTTSPPTSAGGIWNGSTWTPWTPYFSQHTTGFPYALFALTDGTLLIDGAFSFYDNDDTTLLRRRRLVTWNGSAFVPLSTTQYGPRLNTSFTGQGVYHAVRHEGKIVLFTVTALSTGPEWNSNNIPVPSGMITFDGAAFAPHPAPALNGTIACSAVFNGELYVGGSFTAATDNPSVPLNRIARWSGGQWHKCGNGLSQVVSFMRVADDGTGQKLHIFNSGTVVTTAYNNANSTTLDTFNFAGAVRFDGDRFSPYGSGSFPGYVGGAAQCAANLDTGSGPALHIAGIDMQPSGGGFPVTPLAVRRRAVTPDSDGDGISDAWEQNGVDIDCDGTVDLDLPALGADWQHKDIFVEIDSMVGRAPAQSALDAVTAAFNNAPNTLIANPDGQDGVSLHLIVDAADQNIPLVDFDPGSPPNVFRDFHHVKSERFGNAADRASPNRVNILEAKKLVFRYCIFANNFHPNHYSGVAELKGNDFMVTLGSWPTPGGTPQQQAATLMHELGHTLGLYHGGHQKDERRHNYKPNYHSVMNYAWQLQFRPGWTLDYSRGVLPTLDENLLDEIDGIGGDAASIALIGPLPATYAAESGPVDWNRNGNLTFGVQVDVNRVRPDYPPSLDVLEGSEDWSRLVYNIRNDPNYWANGDSPNTTVDSDVMSPQLSAELDAIYAPPCLADLGTTGGAPGQDGALNNNDFIVFIDYFFAGNPTADMGSTGGVPGSDGEFNNNDFVVYIDRFFTGC